MYYHGTIGTAKLVLNREVFCIASMRGVTLALACPCGVFLQKSAGNMFSLAYH